MLDPPRGLVAGALAGGVIAVGGARRAGARVSRERPLRVGAVTP